MKRFAISIVSAALLALGIVGVAAADGPESCGPGMHRHDGSGCHVAPDASPPEPAGKTPADMYWRTLPATIAAEHEHNVSLSQTDGYTVVSHPMQCVELDVSQGISLIGASAAGVQVEGQPELVQRRADAGQVSIPARIIGCVAAWAGYRFD